MSQHYYQTTNHQGEAVRVLAGWDRPLGHFFLTVAYHDAADRDEAGPIYSNLDDPQGGLAHLESFAYYREVLTELGIDVPGAMIEAIEQDIRTWPRVSAIATRTGRRREHEPPGRKDAAFFVPQSSYNS